jgi:serine/threonine-protein kinase
MTVADASILAVQPGAMLAGKYRVDRVIGQGGLGVVVQAHHLSLDEKVAIKLLLPGALGSPSAVARFAREARAAFKIKSEHVARVIDVGELETGAPYMVMEYLEGRDLSSLLMEQGAIAVDTAALYVLQACEALAEAHSLGIVHRDIKPANLFLANRPSGPPAIKVLDFGISKLTLSSENANLTKTMAVMGSPLYMSPEQMQSSKNVDARSDIWSLGIVLYELVTGQAPFQADTLPELVLAVVQREPPALETMQSDLPPGFTAVVRRCLAKDPSVRYATVGELAADLAPFGPPEGRASLDRIGHVLRGGSFVVVVSDASGVSASPEASTALAGPRGTTTIEAVSSEKDGTRPPRRAQGLIALGLIAAAAIGFAVFRARPPLPVAVVPAAAAPPASETAPPPSSTSTSSAAPASSEEPYVSPPAPSAAHPHRAPAPVVPPHATPSAAAKFDCDPPYTLDAENHRRYKVECLGSPH